MTFNTPNPDVYDFLMNRRSVKTQQMDGPPVDKEDLTKILAAAARVPDHGKLAPWRFIILEGADQVAFGQLISKALLEENECSEKVATKMQGYATQAPTLIVAVSSPSDARPIPEWEQILSAGAACQNLLIAATALGYAGQWLTGWASYSDTVKKGLGLSGKEKIAGFLFLGTANAVPSERPRPDLADIVQVGMPAAAKSD
ncbi:nitroreductase [Kordiimonas sediminis]|uniref:Putative NAD(P)H nitroreductase n=1 Tax=Kordiimonas sediminis TaxID=1735581 RepID=A0A919AK70_9PROT|nr:nitroreductase [Kordiimonas sediminis]GHF11392.1 nitroreductase [Kordiimonas sediminis]